MEDNQSLADNLIPADEGQPAEEQQPSYITREEFLEAIEQVKREAQSLTDKGNSRIQKEIAERLKAIDDRVLEMRKDGINIPDSTIQSQKNQVFNDALAGKLSSPKQTPAPQQQQSAAADPTAQRVQAGMEDIIAETGTTLFQSDPEFRMLDQSDPDRFLETYRRAVEAKQRRKSDPAARMPALSQGSPAPDRIAQLTKLQNELLKNPGQNWPEIQKNKLELDKLLKQ